MTNQIIDAATDAAIDAFHDGYFATRNDPLRPSCPVLAAHWDEGYEQARKDRRVRVVMPARPEGYYHQRLDA